MGRVEALRLADELTQIERDQQYASELEERIKHEEVSGSVYCILLQQYCTSMMCLLANHGCNFPRNEATEMDTNCGVGTESWQQTYYQFLCVVPADILSLTILHTSS